MKICEITGKVAVVGNNVSHSNHKTKRKFNPNLKTKRFWSEEEGRWITLKVSAAGMKTINKNGLAAALKNAAAAKKVY
ncbi:MAG: 50S ribosomal protein L28 [Alistipes sp.]|nr:50S ribosomal protein L28 [Alistipes sp.]MDE6779004.1 50S ribosomal protein L28 [Alistipes sp.]